MSTKCKPGLEMTQRRHLSKRHDCLSKYSAHLIDFRLGLHCPTIYYSWIPDISDSYFPHFYLVCRWSATQHLANTVTYKKMELNPPSPYYFLSFLLSFLFISISFSAGSLGVATAIFAGQSIVRSFIFNIVEVEVIWTFHLRINHVSFV